MTLRKHIQRIGIYAGAASVTALMALIGCAALQEEEPRTALSGGDASITNASSLAFSLSIPDLTPKQMEDFSFGNRLFNTNWVIAPSSTTKFSGLGPTFNRVSCSSCHLKDGRGKPPEPGEMMDSMIIRLSIPGASAVDGPNPHAAYGDQLEDRSIPGVPAEGYATVSYTEVKGTYADGTPYTLTVPSYHFHKLNFGPLGDDILFSPRVAPSVFGLGLLEAVPEKDIISRADPEDKNHDGISGRANYVWNVETKRRELGRIGWKANQPTIRQQIAAAFNGDIGISTPLFPKQNCPPIQKKCRAAPVGGNPELSEDFLARLHNYSRTLAVPVARNMDDPQVKRGEKLFTRAKCTACHTPTLKTGNSDIKQLAHQTIHPFTDLLLHDVGDRLADHRPDFEATGSEWRTAPLWGIGLTQTVNGHTRFMHDGRARNLEEAILWHGGEGGKRHAGISPDAEIRPGCADCVPQFTLMCVNPAIAAYK